MLHPTGKCPKHGFALVSMPRDPNEPNLYAAASADGTRMHPIVGARDSKGYSFKCPLTQCLAGIPGANG